MKTTWRGEPVIPTNFKDQTVDHLCRLARRARETPVEIDWTLSRQEIENLRRAIHYRGKRVVGRFKKFDAEVVTAINSALSEPRSPFSLKPPKGSEKFKSSARLTSDGEAFRLEGTANFEVILDWGYAAFRGRFHQDDPWYEQIGEHLGDDLALKIQRAVDQLDWPLSELNDDDRMVVHHVIIGVPKFYGIKRRRVDPATVTKTITVTFDGPLHWRRRKDDPCVFEDPRGECAGIYLWTVPTEGGYRVFYVGQTGVSFRHRLLQHFKNYLQGENTVYEASQLRSGELEVGWPRGLKTIDGQLRLEEYVDRLPILGKKLAPYLDSFRFFLAPLAFQDRLRERIEGALGFHFKSHERKEVRTFLAPGSTFSVLWPKEEPMKCNYIGGKAIIGFPEEDLIV